MYLSRFDLAVRIRLSFSYSAFRADEGLFARMVA